MWASRCCTRGAATVELALLAPAVFLLLIGTIELSRMAWTKQTLDEVAYSTARCMAVSGSCGTATAQKTYAVSRAAAYGVVIADTAVTPASAVDCNGFPDSQRIIIDAPVTSVLTGFIPSLPSTIRSQACFPRLT
jgi:hypothetical protein